MMKIGCCTSGFTGFLSLEDSVEKIGKLGFDFAEINTDGNINRKNKICIKQIIQKYNIFINLNINLNEIFAGAFIKKENPINNFEKIFKELFDWSESIDLMQISFDPLYHHLCWIQKNPELIRFLEKIKRLSLIRGFMGLSLKAAREVEFMGKETIQVLQTALRLARKSSIQIGLENLDKGTATFKDFSAIYQALEKQDNFGILLDLGHLNVQHRKGIINMSMEEYINFFPVPIINFHLSDNNGIEDQHLSIGKGNINFEGIVKIFKKINYNKLVTLEITSPSLDILNEDVNFSYQFLKNII